MNNDRSPFNQPPAAHGRIMQRLCAVLLRASGWTYNIVLPDTAKFVIIGAPHTTNWDFFIMFLVTRAASIRLNWVGKDSLFRGPMNGLMRWLGGVKVNRRTRNNFVQTAIQAFAENEQLMLVLAPEGTRSMTKDWRSGFYHIAMGAKVPILLAAVDYPTRHLQADRTLYPTGNVRADMDIVRAFYAGKRGKFASAACEPHLALEDEPQTATPGAPYDPGA